MRRREALRSQAYVGLSDSRVILPARAIMRLSRGTKVAVLSYCAVTVVGVQTSVAFSSSGVVTASAAAPEVSSQSSPFIRDAASHVNLFVGTTSDGHVFPGKAYASASRNGQGGLTSLQERMSLTGW